MNILYINYVDDNMTSGSQVRPAKMKQAFLAEGHNVVSLNGSQTGKHRKEKIQETLRAIRTKKPDLCYIESPTYPIMLHADRKLIEILHQEGIPIGYFYRDFYKRFPDEFPKRTSISGMIKDIGLDCLQYLTDQCLFNCDVIYVPSEEAAAILPYKDIRPLPPAGENKFIERPHANKNIIYVGGIGKSYGGAMILDTIARLNRIDPDYHLILACREKEWDQFVHPYKKAAWLEVHHVSGDKLEELYARASVAIITKPNSPYNDLAVSVKTFEYMSYGLPQIVSNGKAISKFIEKEKIGFAVEPSVDAFASEIERICNDPSLYLELQNNIRTSLLERNLWIHRVRTVVSDLT